jgi:hypothetical protein
MNLKNSFFIIPLMIVLALFIASGIAGASTANPSTIPMATQPGEIDVGSPDCQLDVIPNSLRETDMPEQDAFADYPFGLVEFQISNCLVEGFAPNGFPVIVTADFWLLDDTNGDATSGLVESAVEIRIPADLTGLRYRKYGPTPDNPIPHWYDFMFDGSTGAVITGNRATLWFVDGMRGDDDLDPTNGIIIDQGGPGAGGTPTMSEWGMIIFVALAGLGSLYYMRKKRTVS